MQHPPMTGITTAQVRAILSDAQNDSCEAWHLCTRCTARETQAETWMPSGMLRRSNEAGPHMEGHTNIQVTKCRTSADEMLPCGKFRRGKGFLGFSILEIDHVQHERKSHRWGRTNRVDLPNLRAHHNVQSDRV